MKASRNRSEVSEYQTLSEVNLSEENNVALTALSLGNFSRLLKEERVLFFTDNLPFRGRIESEFSISKHAFQIIHNLYCQFVSAFKQANLAAKPMRRGAFARANHIFDHQLVPSLEKAGIFVDRSTIRTTFAFFNLQDLQLNSQFNWMGATVDLNTAHGLRSLLTSDASIPAGRREANFSDFANHVLAEPILASLLSAPPAQPLTIKQRCMVFLSASTARELHEALCPQLLTRLNEVESVKVPLELRMFLPGNTVSMSGRARALVYFEEAAHLFQFLNEGPLTETGASIAHELADGNMFLRACAEALGFRGSKLIVLENDLVYVLHELGIKPPASFLNRPYEYQRRTISELFFYF